MSKVKFELNLPGLNELMKSQEMQNILDRKGDQVVRNAGGKGYDKRTHVADFTAITNVYPTERSTARDNAENNTLLKALFSSKG